jgi:hypothetical protein
LIVATAAPILRLLPEESAERYFGSEGLEAIWHEFNTNADHGSRVIEWLDAMLTVRVSGEIEEMNKKANAPKIQETSGTSKGITMKRNIDKEQSRQWQIEMEDVTGYQNKPGKENEDWNQKSKRIRDKVVRELINYEF